jgi:hypothetical protein
MVACSISMPAVSNHYFRFSTKQRVSTSYWIICHCGCRLTPALMVSSGRIIQAKKQLAHKGRGKVSLPTGSIFAIAVHVRGRVIAGHALR